MNYIILGDIHGNLQAFEAVIKSFPKGKASSIICVGDIVGYGANPEECLKLVQSLDAKSVMGNHEAAVIDKADIANFNEYAQEAILWTKKRLSRDVYDYFQTLPLVMEEGPFTFVHGTLHSPDEFRYMTKVSDAVKSFDVLKKKVCFVGHSHRPNAFILKDGRIYRSFEREIVLEDSCKYIINVGSVGQPRDRDNRACYCIYDADRETIEFKRIEYDVLSSRQRIIDAGLPKILGDRLLYGK